MGGGYVAKERKEIELVTESGTEFEIPCITEQLRLLLYNPEKHQFAKKKMRHKN